MSLLVEAFEKLPQPRSDDDVDLWRAGVQDVIREFREVVRERYSEATLERILISSEDPLARRAAAFAFGIIGTMNSNPTVAHALKEDPDEQVRRFAADSIWEVWFRTDPPEKGKELRQAMAQPDINQQLGAITELIRSAPEFAEAYNQRAILHFRRGDYIKAIEDCEVTLRLNPHHFGAASGLGQCYLRLNRPHAALRSFALALELNPTLTHLQETIQTLRDALESE